MMTSRARQLAGLVLTCTLATGCEPPSVKPTADRNQSLQTSRIEGQVVVQSAARGNAVVLLYDAQHPPPPAGSGRPVSFTVISQSTLFDKSGAPSTGPFTAPFTFSLVPPGTYLISGFIDTDTCLAKASPCHPSDFSPQYTVTGQPNLGDVAGGALVDVTATRPQLHPVTIAARTDGGPLEAVTGVTVSFSDSRTLPDPPAFWVDPSASSTRFDPSTGMHLVLKPLTLQGGVVNLQSPVFVLRSYDATGRGAEVWPRVVVSRVSDSSDLIDETAFPRDGMVGRLVITAAIDPSVASSVTSAGGMIVYRDSLPITLQAQAMLIPEQGTPITLTPVPSGRYAITLVQFTGQTWRVPNELSTVVSLDPLKAPEKGQSTLIVEVP